MRRFFSFLLFVLLLCVAVGALWVWKNPRYSNGRLDVGRSLASIFRRGGGDRHYQPEKYTVAEGPYIDPAAVNVLAALSQQRILLAKAVVPSVVSITTTRQARGPLNDDPLFRFQHRNVPRAHQGTEGAQGSGAIVSKEGHIVTNNHVIEGMDDIEVELSDGRRARARLIGTDPETDIAVLKIDEGDLQPLPFGNSDAVEVGETVMAVGNPYGLEESVTQGIISAKGRTASESTTPTALFQTDAAINPGNSGGPLVNVRGELIGINVKIYTETGGWQGVGFAIPSATVRRSMDSILTTGRVVHGYLGIYNVPLTDRAARQRGVAGAKGVLVDRVQANSPAEKADIRAGDLIQKFNGKAVADIGDLRRGVEEAGVNATATVEFLRDGKPLSVQAQIAEKPPLSAQIPYAPGSPGSPGRNGAPTGDGTPLDGVQVGELTPEAVAKRGLAEDTQGVVVETVDSGSPAADKLRPGDIIDRINQQAVASREDYDTLTHELVSGEPALLSVLRSRTRVLVVINPG